MIIIKVDSGYIARFLIGSEYMNAIADTRLSVIKLALDCIADAKSK